MYKKSLLDESWGSINILVFVQNNNIVSVKIYNAGCIVILVGFQNSDVIWMTFLKQKWKYDLTSR